MDGCQIQLITFVFVDVVKDLAYAALVFSLIGRIAKTVGHLIGNGTHQQNPGQIHVAHQTKSHFAGGFLALSNDHTLCGQKRGMETWKAFCNHTSVEKPSYSLGQEMRCAKAKVCTCRFGTSGRSPLPQKIPTGMKWECFF